MRAVLIKLYLRLCALASLPAAHIIGACTARLLIVLPNKTRSTAAANIGFCFPDMDTADRRRLVSRSLVETGKTAAETGPLWYWDRKRILGLVRECSGRDAVDEAFRNGAGAIITTPHLGNWEMSGLYCSSLYPMTSLYRPPRMQNLDAFMQKARERLGARLVPTSASGVRALYKALDRGEFVGILADQEPSRGSGIFVPFFGIPAYTMTLFARLVHRTRAPVFFTYAERLGGGSGFHLHFVAAPAGLANGTIEEITAGINAGIESCIRNIPEQYQWGYKRFRTRPEGMAPLY